MTRRVFKDRMMAAMYEGCRKAARDNWSEMFLVKNTAGLIYGPHTPRRGAGHRCAYWDGRQNRPSLYARAKGTLGYAAWSAGADDAKERAK